MSPPAALPYRLLDTGHGRKLEQVGSWLLDRQAPQAVWRPRLPAARWNAAQAIHHRSTTGGGHWEFRERLPESWEVSHGGLLFEVKPTPFGHLGLFAEQRDQWKWLGDALRGAEEGGRPLRVLNLFAYTGGATLACAAAGAEVCHVDAARGVVEWARENARRNGLEHRPIRWIVDDCRQFMEREIRRNHHYDGLILDPPSFGRGPKKEVWKIEDHLGELLLRCREVLEKRPRFLLLSSHSPGFTPISLKNVVEDVFGERIPAAEGGEMQILEESGRSLPSGSFARVVAGR